MKFSNFGSSIPSKNILGLLSSFLKLLRRFLNILSILTILIQISILLVLWPINPELVFTLIFAFFFLDTAIAIMTSPKSLESQILNISFIVLSISSLVIYGLIYYIKIYYIPAYPSLIHIGSVDAWISFSGSILSGLIVMVSLVFTIKHERLIRNEEETRKDLELSIISTPVLVFEIDENLEKSNRNYRMKKNNNDSIEFYLTNDVFIKNSSNHFAIIRDLKLDSIEIIDTFDNYINKISTSKVISYTFENGDIIPPSTSFSVKYDLNCTVNDFNLIILKFHLIYSDFMNINEYSIDAELSLNILVDDNKKTDNICNEDDNYDEIDEYNVEIKFNKVVNKFRKI